MKAGTVKPLEVEKISEPEMKCGKWIGLKEAVREL